MFHKNKKMLIKIEGMSCVHCAKKVEETLQSIENITKAKVNLKEKTATIHFKETIDKNEIQKKIKNLDYTVKEIIEVQK